MFFYVSFQHFLRTIFLINIKCFFFAKTSLKMEKKFWPLLATLVPRNFFNPLVGVQNWEGVRRKTSSV